MPFLSCEDEKRFFNLFPRGGVIAPYLLSGLLNNKGDKKKVNQLLEKNMSKVLSQIEGIQYVDDINFDISFFGEKGLCYDPNLFLSKICGIYCPYHCGKNDLDYHRLANIGRLYYCGQKEEYIYEMREFLNEIKFKLTRVINRDPSLRIFNMDDNKIQQLIQNRKKLNWFIRNLETFIDSYSIPLDENIQSYFSQDKLIIFLGHLAVSEITESISTGEAVNRKYIRCLKAIISYIKYRRKEDASYTPGYNYADLKGNRFFISADSILAQDKEFSSGLDGYPEECLTEDELLEILPDLKRKIRLEEFKKTISVGWELLPEKEKKENICRRVERKNILKTELEKIELEEKKDKLLEEKTSLFASLPYIANLKGINHFEGYEAYIFGNGKVILEKFYKKTKYGYTPVMNEAIYAMDIKNFEELSKMGKTEVREYAKENDLDVKTIYHTKYFSKRVMALVNSKDYNEDVLDYIEELIGSAKKSIEKRI